VFLTASAITVPGFVLTWFLRELPLQTSAPATVDAEASHRIAA
jgi:hypothetical protein